VTSLLSVGAATEQLAGQPGSQVGIYQWRSTAGRVIIIIAIYDHAAAAASETDRQVIRCDSLTGDSVTALQVTLVLQVA